MSHNVYTPDKWMIVHINDIYKVFGSWYGGYLKSDRWRLNSGIAKVVEKEQYYSFEGYSGSMYNCNKNLYGINSYGSGVLQDMVQRLQQAGNNIEVLTDKQALEYVAKKQLDKHEKV